MKKSSYSIVRLLLRIGFLMIFICPPGMTNAQAATVNAPLNEASPEALTWYDGAIQYSTILDCQMHTIENGAGAFVGYLGDLNNSLPVTNSVYYLTVVAEALGDSCSGQYGLIDISLPPNTSLAISAANPVYCFIDNLAFTDYCPQTLPASSFHPGMVTLFNTYPGLPAAGVWALPQGHPREFRVPVISSAALSGDNFTAAILLADGNNSPTLYPTKGIFVFAAAPLPSAFSKVSPAAGATNQSTSPTLTWNASSGAGHYEYCYGTSNPCSNWTSTSGTSVSLSGLSNNTLYYWQVRAVNSNGTTDADSSTFWSFRTISLSNPPGAFGKVLPTNGATGQATNITLTWNASAGASSYDYCYGTSNPCSNWASAGNAISATLNGLSAGGTYYWQVRANNGSGTTYADSAMVWSFTTASPPAAFSKASPANSAVGQSTSPTLNWNASTGASYYEYCISTHNPCSTWTSTGSATSVTVSGLLNNITYYWQVRAVNAYGNTTADGGDWFFTTASPSNPPGAFGKSLPANGAGGQSTGPTLSWAVSSGIVHYDYCYGTSNPCSNWSSTGTATSITLSGLSAGAIYYWQVRAVNNDGTVYADNSTVWSFTTASAGGPPGAFFKETPALYDANQTTSPTLSWTSSSGVTDYGYCLSTSNGCTNWTSVGMATSVTVSGLLPYTTYYWAVRASNSNGSTLADYANYYFPIYYSFETNAGNLPAAFSKYAPTNSTIDESTSPTLMWYPSKGVAEYDFCISTTQTCSYWRYNGNATSVNLDGLGLSENTTYYWQVRAVNSIGTIYADSSPSAWWSFQTHIPNSPPSAFNKLLPFGGASNLSSGPTLSWAISSGASEYDYCYSTTYPCTHWISAGTATSVTLSGLALNSSYYWQVLAVNAYGTSYADNYTAWMFATHAPTDPPSPFTKLSPFNAAKIPTTNPTLMWSASDGATEYDYQYCRISPYFCSAWINNGTSTHVSLSGLTLNAEYTWQVQAVNAHGTVYADYALSSFDTFTPEKGYFLPFILHK